MNKPKIIVVLGQTATGKSDLAVALAEKFNGEIISADSRQVYKGLDIGTGKITKKEMRSIPHYLLDVANPKKVFSVSDFKKLADKKIANILKNKKIPIMVGGTGFYIQAIVENIILPEVEPDLALRKKLEKKSEIELFEMLKKLDPERALSIDSKNKVRLIRAIEIAKYLGKVPNVKDGPCQYNILQIGLKLPDQILKEKIEKRLEQRIKAGMINEAKKLHTKGLSWKRMNELGLEYRYLASYLQNNISKEEMINDLNKAIWQYAKRQWTWFKRDKNIKWFNPSKKSDLQKIEKEVKRFLR